MKNGFIIVAWLVMGAATLNAQHEFGAWVAVSAGTPTLIGTTEKVSLSIAAVRYSPVILKRPAYSLRYTIDAIPYARLTSQSKTVTGRGAAPIGFEIRYRPGKRIQPAAALTGGFIYFNRNIPEVGGARFNFTADLGFGIHVGLGRSLGMEAGYKYHHLSNGYRAPANPGFDSNLLFVGIHFKK